MATVDTIISDQLTRAGDLANLAVSKINDALASAASRVILNRPTGALPSSLTIAPFESNADFSADFLSQYNGVISSLDPGLLTKMRGFLNEFFPNLSVCTDAVEDWICNQINNGGMGLPVGVENAMFQRGRDRLLLDGARQEDEMINRFAARGFSMPNGVMTRMVRTVQRDVNQKIADYNRDVIVEQAKIQVETTKFAVAQAVDMQKSVISFMLDYIGRYMGIYQVAGQKGAGFVDAKRNMYNSMSDYYRTLVSNYQVDLDKAKFFLEDSWKWQTADGDLFERWATRKTNAAMAAAEALSRMASSAQQSVNAIASLGG